MLNHRTVAVSLLSLLSMCGAAEANTISVTVSGQFGATVAADAYAAPNAGWQIGFNVDDHPVASNVDTLGFDVPFTNLNYQLGGKYISLPASEVRFSSSSNLGLFTAFFGPESGVFSDGTFVPEFSFQGAQLFLGTPASPVLTVGRFPVSNWTFSDDLNFDSHVNAGNLVVVAPAPEPATFALLAAPIMIFALRRRLRA